MDASLAVCNGRRRGSGDVVEGAEESDKKRKEVEDAKRSEGDGIGVVADEADANESSWRANQSRLEPESRREDETWTYSMA